MDASVINKNNIPFFYTILFAVYTLKGFAGKNIYDFDKLMLMFHRDQLCGLLKITYIFTAFNIFLICKYFSYYNAPQPITF